MEKAEILLPLMNFYLVDTDLQTRGEYTTGKIRGFAVGKYTGKHVAVIMTISGAKDTSSCKADIRVSGDDEAMLPTTIEEVANKIGSWTCLQCGAGFNPDQIMQIESGGVLVCRHCNHTLTLDLYRKKTDNRKRMPQMPSGDGGADNEPSLDDIGLYLEEVEAAPQSSIDETLPPDPRLEEGIAIVRGCAIAGNRFEYKVKVRNDSPYVITNVIVTIASFPKDSLAIDSDPTRAIPRIETGGFRSPQFAFMPTRDCVEGKILAFLSFMDHKDNLHTMHVKPYYIRSVCDLLKPLESTPVELDSILDSLDHTDLNHQIGSNPRILLRRIEQSLPTRNFYIVDKDERVTDGRYVGVIRIFAEGKHTGKRIALVLEVEGRENDIQSTLKTTALGDDLSMLPVALTEIHNELVSWTCIRCGCPLAPEDVIKIKSGYIVSCMSCMASLTLEVYQNQ